MPDICRGGVPSIFGGGDGGLFLPLGGDAEADFEPEYAKSLIYLAGLLWCLAGLAIASDVFMGAIETITSRRRLAVSGQGRVQGLRATCGGMLLMAFGSVAPTILLGIIELFQNEMRSGDLGASTAVGSAAFNMLAGLGVCVLCVPSDQLRRVKEVPTFLVAACFCVLTYVWVFMAIAYISPDVVEWWEALATLGFVPLLIGLSYLADSRCGRRRRVLEETSIVLGPDRPSTEVDRMMSLVRQKYGADAEPHLRQLLEHEFAPKQLEWPRARIHASRCLSGGRRVLPMAIANRSSNQQLAGELKAGDAEDDLPDVSPVPADKTSDDAQSVSVVDFVSENWVIQEADRSVRLVVRRTGDTAQALKVPYETRDGTARGGQDYTPKQDTLLFGPGERERNILLNIVDDRRTVDGTDEFYVDLAPPHQSNAYTLGEARQATIKIMDCDGPGIISFAKSSQTEFESHERREISVEVLRKDGVNGAVACHYRTTSDTAVPDVDYIEKNGTLLFHDGQASAHIKLEILPKGRAKVTDTFLLVVEDASGGARFDGSSEGGTDKSVCKVRITASREHEEKLRVFYNQLCTDWHQVSIGTDSLAQQFYEAIFPGGGLDASILDWLLHTVLLPWKLLFAFLPPTRLCGGWLCFFCALFGIACMAIIIGDLTSLLGCTLGIDSGILGMSVVAVGLSLPDVVASRLMAAHNDRADDVLSSIAVNTSMGTLLGMGIPWIVGSLYWLAAGADLSDVSDPWMQDGRTRGWWNEYPHIKKDSSGGFVVLSRDLGLRAALLAGCGLLCFASLAVRRLCVGGEFGGPWALRWATAVYFFLLWAFYFGASWFAAAS